MGTLVRRGGKYRAEVCVNRRRQSATFATKAEARAWIDDRERRLSRGPSSDKTLGDAFLRFAEDVSPKRKGERWEAIRLTKLANDPMLGPRPLASLSGPILAAWRDHRLKSVSDGTVRRELGLIRSVLETARLDWGWLTANPMADVRKPPAPKARTRRITDDEIERLCLGLGYEGGQPENASQRVAVAFLFALETGMRSGEILGLTWDRIHLRERYVTLEQTKNGDARNVPLSKEAVRLLSLLPDESETAFDLDPAIRDALFRKGRDRAMIKDLRFHDSRHEAVTRLARKIDVLDLARMIGHRDLRSLQVYYNAHASEIAKRLD